MYNPKGPMRIALFTETFLPKVDGIVSILCLMLRRFQEEGHEVIVFAPKGAPSEYAGAQVIGTSGISAPFYPELKLSVAGPRIWHHLQRFRPDIVHVLNPFVLGPFGLWFARRLRAPVVASFHTDVARYAHHYGLGLFSPVVWNYMRFLHNQADVNLCPSTAVRADLIQHGFRRVRWWHRGIDTELFNPGPRDLDMRARLTGGNPDDFLILNVGRQAPEKNLEQLRDTIFPRPGVRLAMVGGGPTHDSLKSHFAGTPTTFPGYLKGQDLVNAYRAADAFIFPSTTETFGLVALEAMACGVPVIAARSGGILDTVVHGVNGLMFDPAQPREIGEQIDALRHNPQMYAELSANALNHARNRSWRATMDQLINYYRTAIRVHQRGLTGPAVTNPV